MTDRNQWQTEARMLKARRLAAGVRAAGGRAADLDLPDFPWSDLVAATGVKPPSDITKAIVRHLLELLEAQDRRSAESDPFVGL